MHHTLSTRLASAIIFPIHSFPNHRVLLLWTSKNSFAGESFCQPRDMFTLSTRMASRCVKSRARPFDSYLQMNLVVPTGLKSQTTSTNAPETSPFQPKSCLADVVLGLNTAAKKTDMNPSAGIHAPPFQSHDPSLQTARLFTKRANRVRSSLKMLIRAFVRVHIIPEINEIALSNHPFL